MGLIHGKRAFRGPFYVALDITRRCNIVCIGCGTHSSQTRKPSPKDYADSDISFDIVEKLCKELPPLDTKEVVLIGEGEPFLHPRIFDIIKAFKKASMNVKLLTNGTLIDKSNVQSILDSGLDTLKISLWANNLNEFTKCHPGIKEEIYHKIIDGINIISHAKSERKAKHPKIVLTQTINRNNYKSLKKRAELVQSLNCNGLSFAPYNDREGEFGELSLDDKEVRDICKELLDIKNKLRPLKISHKIEKALLRFRLGEKGSTAFPCYVGWFHARVKADGTVLPCNSCFRSMGNLRNKSFVEIWNSDNYREFRKTALSQKGIGKNNTDFECNWCNYIKDLYNVHRVFKWMRPFLNLVR